MLGVVVDASPVEAIEIGREALALAESLGLEELRAHALNTIGIARMELDDMGGIEELEESLRLVLEHGSPFEITRVYNNLAWGYVFAGRMDDAVRASAAQLETARQFALSLRWAAPTGLAENIFIQGDWGQALSLVEAVLEQSQGEPAGVFALELRAEIRLARGELVESMGRCGAPSGAGQCGGGGWQRVPCDNRPCRACVRPPT